MLWGVLWGRLYDIHWIVLYVNGDNIIYFDDFGVEHIPKEIKKFIGNKNIIINIYRIKALLSITSITKD